MLASYSVIVQYTPMDVFHVDGSPAPELSHDRIIRTVDFELDRHYHMIGTTPARTLAWSFSHILANPAGHLSS